MKLRSNRDTASTSAYVPETSRKTSRPAVAVVNKNTGRKRRNNDSTGRPSKKKAKVS